MSIRSSLVLTAFVGAISFSASAQAQGVAVQIAGRDKSSVYNDLVQAAEKSCSDARRVDYFDDYGSQDDCVSQTLKVAVTKLADQGGEEFSTARYESSQAPDFQ